MLAACSFQNAGILIYVIFRYRVMKHSLKVQKRYLVATCSLPLPLDLFCCHYAVSSLGIRLMVQTKLLVGHFYMPFHEAFSTQDRSFLCYTSTLHLHYHYLSPFSYSTGF